MDAPDGRVGCCIVDCGRTRPLRDNENAETANTVCARHWRMAPAKARADIKTLRRIIRKRPAHSAPAIGLHNRLWSAAVDAINAQVTGAPIDGGVQAFLDSL